MSNKKQASTTAGNVVGNDDGFFTTLKNIIIKPFSYILGKVKDLYNFTIEKMGDYASLLWIVGGILMLTLFSPAAGFSAFMFVLSLTIYIAIFVVVWNTVNNLMTPNAA
ncbi:MAG: hypothetical protein DRQ78_08465 [Epsilonproteobacteria bacterium]|nr:MAG: hypothetical protein DRQ78_08465 [Campylobacterota bacterium]